MGWFCELSVWSRYYLIYCTRDEFVLYQLGILRGLLSIQIDLANPDDVIKWKHFPHHWTFVRGIHRSPVNSSPKRQWRGAWMFFLTRFWIHGWVNNGRAGDLRRHRTHYDVTVMVLGAKYALNHRQLYADSNRTEYISMILFYEIIYTAHHKMWPRFCYTLLWF